LIRRFADRGLDVAGRCHLTLGQWDRALSAFRTLDDPPFWTLACVAACEAMAGRPDFHLGRFLATLPYRDPDMAVRFFRSLDAAGLGTVRGGSP
jgi:hypothetical protein